MSQLTSTQRARAADKRLVLCTCSACKAQAAPPLRGRMIASHKRRHHLHQEVLHTTNPALKNRGKRSIKGGIGRSRGRAGLPNITAGSQAFNASQAGPSQFQEDQFIAQDVPEGSPGGPGAPGEDQLGWADQDIDIDLEERPAVDGVMPQIQTANLSPPRAGNTASESPLLFDSEFDEGWPDVHEDAPYLYGDGPLDSRASDSRDEAYAASPSSPGSSVSSSDSDTNSSDGSRSDLDSLGISHPDRSIPAIRHPQLVSLPGRQVSALATFARSHEKWYIRWILLLVAFLHTKHHLSFRAAGLLLWTLRTIFVLLGLLAQTDNMPTTLSTAFTHLGFSDTFSILLMCPQCREICGSPLPMPAVEYDSRCHACDAELYTGLPKEWFNTPAHARHPLKKPPQPKLVAPYKPLVQSLAELLARSGMEDEMEAWRSVPQTPGMYKGIWDGNVWKSLEGADEELFFGPRHDDELRLGVTASLDWFQARRGDLSPSHSSGVVSFTIANLLPELKYQPQNLLVTTNTPGPTEPTATQLQLQLALIVTELLMLYQEGVMIRTPRFPQGRRVRVALIAIVCDHPAAVKMCGSADKGHNEAPCTRCTVTQAELFSDNSLRNGFPQRDGQEHKAWAFEYETLESTKKRDEFFKKRGVRWYAFARLPYFDAVRMTIIDPMHNLLMGVLKYHWYNTWILGKKLRANTAAKKRELDLIHEHLENFEMPPYVARPARNVGETAGGGLSADTYKGLGTVFLPAIAPLVWDASLDAATQEYQRSVKSYNQRYQKWDKKYGKSYRESKGAQIVATQQTQPSIGPILPAPKVSKSKSRSKPIPDPPKTPEARMQAGEDELFLKLGTATKMFTQFEVTALEIERAGDLITEYLLEYKEVYGESMLRPNHHFVVHLREQMYDYGPVYGFWCFLGERLNKLLKSFKSNNWGGGQLEVSMMREWGRDLQIQATLRALTTSEDPQNKILADFLLAEPTEKRGTVESIAAAHQDALSDAATLVPLVRGPVSKHSTTVPSRCQSALAKYYNAQVVQPPAPRAYMVLDPAAPPGGTYLSRHATYLRYVVHHGRRIVPSHRTHAPAAPRALHSALVKVHVNTAYRYGEVIGIFEHIQAGHPPTLFAEIAWFTTIDDVPLANDVWAPFPELDIHFHSYGALDQQSIDHAAVPLTTLQCHLARGTILHLDPPLWVTVSLEKMSPVIT